MDGTINKIRMKSLSNLLTKEKENYIEVKSLIAWMREAKNYYFQDEGLCNEPIKEFIEIVHGVLIELCDENDLIMEEVV